MQESASAGTAGRESRGMIAVIGCGNPNRSDDGVGPQVLRLLAEDASSGCDGDVRLLDAGTDGMAVMFAARGCAKLIVVDACRSGSECGAVFEVPGTELEAEPRDSLNLHDFRWDNALFAGRKIFRDEFPADVTVFLIEAGSVDLGIGLSDAVAVSARKVAGRIRELIAERSSCEGKPS
ncbi:MAG: hydrogenase maturation protease [Rhodomicrobiaceae bacterium]